MRITAFLATLALFAATAAPAGACVVHTVSSYYFETPPADLAPNEVVLEVRFQRAETYRLPTFFLSYTNRSDVIVFSDQYSSNHRHSVVRVVRGAFSGDTVLLPVSSICGGVATAPPNGAGTSFVVGFVAPPSLDWQDAPILVARYPQEKIQDRRPSIALLSAALDGDPVAMMKLGRNTRDPAMRKGLYDRASTILRARAEINNVSAMIELGLALREGRAVDVAAPPRQPDEPYHDPAAEWLERAASLGSPRAMYLMAESYTHLAGRIPPLERAKLASEWYLKGAEAGHACSMGRMAQRYRWGYGVPVDKEQSLYWYRKAIAAGAIMSPYGYEIDSDPPPGVRDGPSLECPRDS